jgi:tRNA G18 (ribose-2'-O)-methylase SpoU
MFEAQEITSFDHPELLPYRTMRRQMEQRQQGIFVAEGEKVVRRLLESSLTVLSVLLPEKWFLDLRPILQSRPELITVFVAEKKLLESLTGFSMYQGLLAVGKVPPAPTLDELVREDQSPHLLVAVESLSSAENLGAVVRNSAAFGARGLIAGESCTSPYLRRAVRSSMGTIFMMPIIESLSLQQTLYDLKRQGFRCVAAHPHALQTPLASADLRGNCCLVFGSEGYGLSPGILEICDQAVAIPMAAAVDSLNVGSAAAVFLYEAWRQRQRT